MRTIHQINLQRHFGGGEVYTRFVCAALAELGWRVVLYVSVDADFWSRLNVRAELAPVASLNEVAAKLPENSVVMTHNVLNIHEARAWSARYVLTGFLHMPLYDRDPAGLASYRRLFGVSRHVLDSAQAKGLANAWPEPLYGVADLERGATPGEIRKASEYDWDRRKLRDRTLGLLEPLASSLRSAPPFSRRPGLTLGIVSRLTPIKQWPLLFRYLAPILARHPQVNVEIFGSGGYASVRDLRRALAPLGDRARFWGQQQDMRGVYPLLDYVLSGLPEKEALGLNLIEAQSCGTPVLAVNAPPFTETVLDGASGYLYADPRTDQGQGFAVLLDRLLAGAPRPDPRLAAQHLEKFGAAAFQARLAAALDGLA